MKKCDYCGRENDEAQEACSGCGGPLVAKPPSREQRASVPIGVGFALQILGRPLTSALDNRNATLLGGALVLLGTVILVWASMRYASVKGYHRWLGWLGLLSGPGLIILFLLPDRRKEAAMEDGKQRIV